METASSMTEDRWTVGRLLDWTADYFGEKGLEDARLSAEVLLAHAVGCNRIDLYARFDVLPDEEKTKAFRQLVKRAAAREPIAYLVGQKEFFSLAFEVTPDVLIPRGETETLVECVIDHCRQVKLTDASKTKQSAAKLNRCANAADDFPSAHQMILDVGTGSGCIPIAILSHLEGATAVASDISPAALQIASKNAERHGLADRITFCEADRLAIPAKAIPKGGFDVLVSNPPYVAAPELATLDPTVRDYEPNYALTDGLDGLSFYKTIASEGRNLLRPDGIVFVEIADGQQGAVRDTMTKNGHWSLAGTWKDAITGKPRVLSFTSRDCS